LAGPLGPLLAPPYDVARAPAATPRYAISEIENADLGVPGDPHAVAAERYRAWRRQGILRQDDAVAIYVHRHRFLVDGVPRLRTAFIALVRLAEWQERIVLPHERTTPGPRQERLERLRAVNANLSPLYFLYRDAESEIADLLAEYAPDEARGKLPVGARHAVPSPALDEQDRMGGAHHLQTIRDPVFHHRLAKLFRDRQVFVADGHHRYEAALTYRNEQRRGSPDSDADSQFVLALLAAVDDPGVVVLPTHRLVAGLPDGLAEGLPRTLRRWFDLTPAADVLAHDGAAPLFRLAVSGQSMLWDVSPRPDQAHRALLDSDRSPAWQTLGVSAVGGVLEKVLGLHERSADLGVTFTVAESEARDRVARGAAQAAFLLSPPDLDRILAVAEEGDLLPPKSTWFEPKAPAGLVINELAP
jgi:uncharacterized protein (DUF1015 family)